MILLVAGELNVSAMVHVYQSRWFKEDITAETLRLEQLGLGVVHWTEEGSTVDESLTELRRVMLTEWKFQGAVFVGGMQGVIDEFRMYRELWPNSIALAMSAPGGASRLLVDDGHGVLPPSLRELANSDRYPEVFYEFVKEIRSDKVG